MNSHCIYDGMSTAQGYSKNSPSSSK